MECKNCGTQNPDGSAFCLNCGNPFAVQNSLDPEAAAEAAVDAAPAELHCPNCGAAIDDKTVFCGYCGAGVRYEADPVPTVEEAPAPKKKGKAKKIILTVCIILAVLLIGFAIAGLCTNWFGLYGPITQIAAASQKTFSNYNLSADYEINVNDTTVSGTVYLDMDVEEEIVQLYLDVNSEKSKYIVAIYDDQLIYGKEDDLSTKDIGYYISTLCDSIEKEKGFTTFDEAWDTLIDMIPNKQQEEINEEYVQLDLIKKLVKSFFLRKLNNAEWLKENAGYSTSTVDGIKIHSFEPDVVEFLGASLEHFEDAFVKASVYNDAMDAVESIEEYTEDLDIYIGFGIKNGKLVLIESEVIVGETTVSVDFEFYDIGKTEIDEDMLDDLLDAADLNY